RLRLPWMPRMTRHVLPGPRSAPCGRPDAARPSRPLRAKLPASRAWFTSRLESVLEHGVADVPAIAHRERSLVEIAVAADRDGERAVPGCGERELGLQSAAVVCVGDFARGIRDPDRRIE